MSEEWVPAPKPPIGPKRWLAGPALDAEIFERVFGQSIRCSHGIQCADIPPFSSDIASAWLIVEPFYGLCFQLEEDQIPDGPDRLWVATFEMDFDEWTLSETARGETPALAICRAALLVLDAVKTEGE